MLNCDTSFGREVTYIYIYSTMNRRLFVILSSDIGCTSKYTCERVDACAYGYELIYTYIYISLSLCLSLALSRSVFITLCTMFHSGRMFTSMHDLKPGWRVDINDHVDGMKAENRVDSCGSCTAVSVAAMLCHAVISPRHYPIL